MDQDEETKQERPRVPPPPKGRLGKWIYALAAWSQRHRFIVRGAQAVGLIGIMLIAFYTVTSDEFRNLFHPYLGAFIINLLSSTTIVLPAPGLFITCGFAAPGLDLDIWLLSLTASIGATMGEVVAYLVGYTGSAMVTEAKPDSRVERLRPRFERRGGPVLLFLAFLPVPVFDLAGILAGALRMNIYKFLAWVFAGKMIKFVSIGWVCRVSIPWLEEILVDGLIPWLLNLLGM